MDSLLLLANVQAGSADDEKPDAAVAVGIGAEASRQASKWKERLGRIGYAVGAVHAALRPPAVRGDRCM